MPASVEDHRAWIQQGHSGKVGLLILSVISHHAPYGHRVRSWRKQGEQTSGSTVFQKHSLEQHMRMKYVDLNKPSTEWRLRAWVFIVYMPIHVIRWNNIYIHNTRTRRRAQKAALRVVFCLHQSDKSRETALSLHWDLLSGVYNYSFRNLCLCQGQAQTLRYCYEWKCSQTHIP